jgi:hypothetical protein
MTDCTPVLDRAIRLQNEVRRLEAGAQGEGQALRIAGRVAEIQSALTDLAGHVRAARALKQHDPGAAIDLTGLDAGRDGLARLAVGSIPSDPAFVAARRKVRATTVRITAELLAAWKIWADHQLSTLPEHKIAVLPIERQPWARATLKNLRSLSGAKTITTADIAEFASAYKGLTEELSEIISVPEKIVTIMNRIWAGGVTLRNLSDEEIVLLRKYRMDGEIELRRKNG